MVSPMQYEIQQQWREDVIAMSDEARAAAERLLQAEVEQDIRQAVGNDTDYCLHWADDVKAVANAYLAEHRPNDWEVIDEAWLREVGFDGDQFCLCTSDHDTEGTRLCIDITSGMEKRCWTQETWYKPHPSGMKLREIENVKLPLPITRGDLRRLASALGITLTENPT